MLLFKNKYLCRRNILSGFLLALLAVPAFAQFWDQGMEQGLARSDFSSSAIGTVWAPIDYGICLYPGSNFPCDGPIYWPQSNWKKIGNPTDRYWVIHHNNSQMWRAGTIDGQGEIGPPGQTRSIGAPGEQGHGFHMTHIDYTVDGGIPADDGWHFIINTDTIPEADRASWAERSNFHLSFGARQNRGNGSTPPAVLNGLDHWLYGDPQYLSFNAQQIASTSGTKGGGSYRFSGIYLTAEWGEAAPGVPQQRGVFVVLFEDAVDHPGVDETLFPGGVEALPDWNWPFKQSFFYPGVEWLFVTIDHLKTVCPDSVLSSGERLTVQPTIAKSNQTAYKFQLTDMFQCLDSLYSPWSDPFPTDVEVPLTGVFWFQEVSNAQTDEPAAGMWMQIDDARVRTF